MLSKFNLNRHKLFFLLTTIVILKFFFVRFMLFDDINIFSTLFLELGYLIIMFALIEFITSIKTLKVIYFTTNLMISIILFAILIYYDYFGYIVTPHALMYIGQVGTVSDSVLQLIKPIYLFLFIDFFLLILYRLFQKKAAKNMTLNKNNRFVISALCLGVLLTGVNILLHNDKNIANTVVAAEKQGIFTYELLAVRDLFKDGNKLSVSRSSLQSHINSLKDINPHREEGLQWNGVAKDKNMIVIQAEAFQQFVLNLEIDGKEVTPVLNKLLKESIHFPNVYQQIGHGNTSDAEFIFNTSLYPADLTATSNRYGDRSFPSLPKLLKEEDYKSITFHANDVTFWNRMDLYPALGFDQYYDINFFGEEDVIGIGPSDEVLFQKALPELIELHENEENFYAQFITLTSHGPFNIPEEKKFIDLPERFDGSLVGGYLEAVNYTDHVLGNFIHTLKDEGIWDDSIFVFYGDHFGLQPNLLEEQDNQLLAELIGHPYTFIDQFNIPFMITIPGISTGEVVETVGGQVDMLPTLANLLGISLENHIHFGQDLVNYPNNLFGMRFYMPTGSFFNEDIVFRPYEGFTDGDAFNIHTHQPVEDFSKYNKDYNRILSLLELSDGFLNSLPLREELK